MVLALSKMGLSIRRKRVDVTSPIPRTIHHTNGAMFSTDQQVADEANKERWRKLDAHTVRALGTEDARALPPGPCRGPFHRPLVTGSEGQTEVRPHHPRPARTRRQDGRGRRNYRVRWSVSIGRPGGRPDPGRYFGRARERRTAQGSSRPTESVRITFRRDDASPFGEQETQSPPGD